jgi:hypothetical protein
MHLVASAGQCDDMIDLQRTVQEDIQCQDDHDSQTTSLPCFFHFHLNLKYQGVELRKDSDQGATTTHLAFIAVLGHRDEN